MSRETHYKLYIRSLALAGLSILMSVQSYAFNIKATYVITPFSRSFDIPEEELIKAASAVSDEFLANQPGFIKRSLHKSHDGVYVDVIQWRSFSDAKKAENQVNKCEVCQYYINLMDTSKVKTTIGVTYMEPIKSW